MVVNIQGKGNAGQHNGINGNIQVYIQEEKNDTFVRDGQDLYYTLLLDLPTAVLGGNVDIPLVNGSKMSLKIDAGTQPGKQVRLRGKGLPAVQGYGSGTGDIIVNISVYIPETLTHDEKKLFEKIRESENVVADNSKKKSLFEHIKNLFN
jgi:molecular chaperone DnaJ